MRTHVRLGLGLALAGFFAAGGASATTVLEVGDNGSEQMGRGGAWVARASDPLAAFYNPAGLAGQDTKLTLQANINMLSTCFSRVKSLNDGTTEDGNATTPSISRGGSFPQICNNAPPFPDPQIAFTYKVSPRFGLGLAILGPSAAGQQSWPATAPDGSPAPQRYLITSANTLVLFPTIAAGWEPIDRLRIGASFLWGVANLDISNYSWATNTNGALSGSDVKGELKVSDPFMPGFTLGTIWSPTDQLDVAGWYKYTSPIDAKGDVLTTSGSGKHVETGNTAAADCGVQGFTPPPNTCVPNVAHVKIQVPMEAKIGLRFHVPREGAELAHRRDPMSQDIFDVEADLTWANNSAFDKIQITFPGANGVGTVPVPGNTPGSVIGQLPPDASVPHNFKDVLGVRLGGDFNVIPDRFAIRAGSSFESQAQSAQYQNVDFVGEWRFGLALGGTYRFHLSSKPSKSAVEVSLGFGHTFIGTSTYTGQNGGVQALSGVQCNPAPINGPAVNVATSGGVCTDGNKQYRSEWPVNLGTITSSFNQINLGVSYRF